MNNQEFQAVLQSLPVGFDIVVNGSSHFDVRGHFEIKEGYAKGVIHITDISPSKFLKNKEEMIRDINAGISFSEINKKYGISRNTYGRFKKQKAAPPDVKIDDEIQEKIKADVKLGLFTPQILKKYHINVPTLATIKKSIKTENSAPSDTESEDDLKAVKKRLDYGRIINNGSNKVLAAGMLKGINPPAPSSVDINKFQEIMSQGDSKIHLSSNPSVRDWQIKSMARGL
ncbi:MAG: hypothetical protein ACYCSB_07045 [bacterium]